ncbi:hypothetical protein SAMD00019534_038790 [Acytostelium subglobosum LB1]|uniref:hypothetical protein n=1 Tax=Acytostelium subglobosum LB1 TaxID=1410327 RepID=UPI000644DDC8|nr:hypothetical protein SAMD00019534_038790 [Acytostelium subglobosum LB1]GAM20704.1 hypothetical protein SAMD00019534_038790 [Acytostelium subglobosum LB1]|eukprot:XP_012760225.1 hypothetical protein SAMD00019534_038790 [Acytostelium subglobosum LB1]
MSTKHVDDNDRGLLNDDTRQHVGGLDRQCIAIIEALSYYVATSFKGNQQQQQQSSCIEDLLCPLGTPRPVHLLLSGRSGLGKSLLIQTILGQFKARQILDFVIVNSSHCYKENDGDTERYLSSIILGRRRSHFDKPFVLVFEEVDSISVRRQSSGLYGQIEQRVSSHLLDLLRQNSHAEHPIFIVGVTSRIDTLDDDFFQCGHFDSVINLPIPLPIDRQHILAVMIKRYANYSTNMDHYDQLIVDLASCTHGYVGADLQNLCNEAATLAITGSDSCQLSTSIVTIDHFRRTFASIKPSILKEFKFTFERIGFQDIGGLDDIVAKIRTTVLLPIMNPEPLIRIGAAPPSGILLFGPPGNGKSLIARAIASSSPNVNFISIQSTDIISPVVGESEKNLTRLFRVVRESAPCVLFLDQVEVLAKKRGYDTSSEQSADRLLSCLLIEMDGFAGSSTNGGGASSIILAATTRLDMLDPTILRPGRFDYHLEVPLPNDTGRIDILGKLTKQMPLSSDVDLVQLSSLTSGLCGADLNNLCKEAALIALRHNINSKDITMTDDVVEQRQSKKRSNDDINNNYNEENGEAEDIVEKDADFVDSSEEDEDGEDEYQYDDFVVGNSGDEGDDDIQDDDDKSDEEEDPEEAAKRREARRIRREEKRRLHAMKKSKKNRLHRLKKLKSNGDDIEEKSPSHEGHIDDDIEQDRAMIFDESEDDFVVDANDRPIRRKSGRGTPSKSYGGIFGDDDEEMLVDDKPKDTLSLIREQYEPSLLEEKHFTDADEEIRKKNVPERMQLRKCTQFLSDRQTYEEAEWIYDMSFDIKESKDSMMIETIATILKFFQREMLEVPFVYAYRKDVFEPQFRLQDLWTIYDLDEKWAHLIASKKSLEQFITANPNLEQYQQTLRECKLEEGITDLYDLFQMINGPDFKAQQQRSDDQPKPKRAIKRDLYTIYTKDGLGKFLPHYGITPQEFGINLMDNYMTRIPTDHSEDPSTTALKYICIEADDMGEVLRATRYLMAHDIGFDPNVRQSIRGIYRRYAFITTTPTSVGQKEIDAFHPYITVKSIHEKPCHMFDDTQFLLILKAEREGFIKAKVGVPEHVHNNVILPEMEGLFLSDGTSAIAQQWNAERKMVLRESLTGFLYPVFEKELRNKLLTEASNRVAFECARRLEEKLRVAPWQPNQDEDEDDDYDYGKKRLFHVMSFCNGSEKIPTMCAVLDSESEIVTHSKMDFLCDRVGETTIKDKKQDDVSRLTDLMSEYQPRLILVSATEMVSKRLLDEIRELVGRLSNDGTLKRMPAIQFANPEIGLSEQNSARYADEFKEYPPVLKHAIAIARCALDPMTEYSNLCTDSNEILYLKLHPLQDMIGKDYLLKLLHRCFVNVVNAVGVDINRMIRHKFTSSPLQFVSGLGSRKAQALLNASMAVIKRGKTMSSRQAIEKIFSNQDIVYRNCIGFIQIREKYFGDEDMNPLDDTRVHPEDYLSAYKIAADALDKTVDQDFFREDTLIFGYVRDVMRKPKKLESIDLDAFADLLESRQNTQKKKLLYAIKSELTSPFADIRTPYLPPSQAQIFSWLTGETDQTLRVGTMVSVTTFRNDVIMGVRVRLDNGLEGTIPPEYISESNDVKSMPRGVTLNCRVVSVEKDRFHVTLSNKQSDMQNSKWEDIIFNELKHGGQNPYLVLDDSHSRQQQSLVAEKKRQSVPARAKKVKRVVVHPLWHSFTCAEAESHLKDKPVGEAILRPSSRGFDHITVTFKFWDNIIIHHDIKEKDKPNPVSLGKSFYIGDTRYDSLDEILSRHVEYLINNLNNVQSHKYWRSGTQQQIDDQIKRDKQRYPKSIPYAFGINQTHPGYLILYHVPNTNPRHEHILIKDDGYEMRKKTFATIDELIKYFKQNYSQILSQSARPSGSTTTTSSSNQSSRMLPSNKPDLQQQHQQHQQYQPQQQYHSQQQQQHTRPQYSTNYQPQHQPPPMVHSNQPYIQQQQQIPARSQYPQQQHYQQPMQQQQQPQSYNQQQTWRGPQQAQPQGMYQPPPQSQYMNPYSQPFDQYNPQQGYPPPTQHQPPIGVPFGQQQPHHHQQQEWE